MLSRPWAQVKMDKQTQARFKMIQDDEDKNWSQLATMIRKGFAKQIGDYENLNPNIRVRVSDLEPGRSIRGWWNGES